MKKMAVAVTLLVAVGMAGCAAEPATDPAATPTTPAATSAPSPTPTPTPTPTLNLVNPADFSTPMLTFDTREPVEGVSFGSADLNLSCAIFKDFSTVGELIPPQTALGGCVPMAYDYVSPRPDDMNENIGCHGAYVTDVDGPFIICNNGQVFPFAGESYGQAGATIFVPSLPVGSAISVHGITCESVDEGTIRCQTDATGHGFEISRSEHATF